MNSSTAKPDTLILLDRANVEVRLDSLSNECERIGSDTDKVVALGCYKYPRTCRALITKEEWPTRLCCPSAAPVLWPVGTVWHWCGTIAGQ
jgi:hypothetical protein